MCILSYLPANVAGDEMDLLNGAIANPHGHGWAITDRDRILVGKGMVAENVLDEFVDMRKRFPAGHALFHSRWATHGNVDTENCHPFTVGHNPLTVVGHNGILSCTPEKSDPRSDTRLFADEILSTRYRRLDKPRAMTALTNFIGSYNKLVILTVDPRYKRNAYLVNEKAGNWDKLTGTWHSNYDYLGYQRYGTYTPGSYTETSVVGKAVAQLGSKAIAADWADCDMCYGYVGKSGFCVDCGTCEDCYEERDDCQCWTKYRDEELNSSRVVFSSSDIGGWSSED